MYSKILRDSPSRDAASAKHVTPPDPKQLPMPSAFLSSNSHDGNMKPKKQVGKPLNMNDLWTAVEEASAPQQPPANDDSAITASVQQFFANHQHLQQTPPVAQENSSFPGPPQFGGGAPIFQQPHEVAEQPRSTGFNANFIPLQVQRSQIGRGRGGGGGRGRGGKKQDHGDGAQQQFYHHQPPQSYHQAEGSGQQQYYQQPHPQPQHAGRGKPRGRGRGGGRGRGQLAANFSYNP